MQGKRILMGTMLTTVLVLCASAATAEPAQWKERKAGFLFKGWNTLYTCNGLYDKLRDIFRELGARSTDLHINIGDCPVGANTPMGNSWVSVSFYSLEPAAGGGVDAQWAAFKTTPGTNHVLSTRDCELLEDLKPLITGNFTLRNATYDTNCVPGTSPNANFTGETLKIK